MIYWLNAAFVVAFDWLQKGFSFLGEWGELAAWALLLAALAVRGWTRFSDQEGIRRSREKLQGDILAIRLFQNDLGVFFRIQRDMLQDALGYLHRGVTPALVLAVPVALCLVQFEARYGPRPLRPGEQVLVAVHVADPALLEKGAVTLEGGNGIEVETSGVRNFFRREIAWRVRAKQQGTHRLTVRAGKQVAEKEVVVGPAQRLVSRTRVGEDWLELLLHPGEPPLECGSGVVRVKVDYPRRTFIFWGWEVYWVIPFFVLFLVFGYALKNLWRVEI